MNAPSSPPSAPARVPRGTAAAFGDRVSTGESVRAQHGRDESSFAPMPPDAVVFPRSTDEVVAIVKACAAHDVPMIPYGVGSSLEGHVLAVQGGVSIDLSQMNRIIAVNADDLDVVVEAGVTRKQLNEHLRDTGLFFPLDPGADATLGGMAATRASGTNAVRYGTMRESVLALTVVLADGSVIRTGTRARKSSAGYDLTRLFVGSEGTLGIITEVTVRLHPQPEAVSAAICQFPTVRDAVETVIRTIQLGVPIARCELLDAASIRAINLHSKLGLREAPMLFFEFHGSPASVKEQAESVQTSRRRASRDGIRVVGDAGGAVAAVGRAAQRLLRVSCVAAECAGAFDRCVRADLAAGGLHRRDRGGGEAVPFADYLAGARR